MLYLSPPCTPAVRDAMQAGRLGMITTPRQGNRVPDGDLVRYAADNGRFGRGWPGERKWFRWLERKTDRHGRDRCLWALAPDVPYDAQGTLRDSTPWLGRIRSLGLRAAFAAQDGSEHGLIPWDDLDVLFLAGTTAWKLSAVAADLALEAAQRGKAVHFGRANSEIRIRHAMAIGSDTADGTYLRHGPDRRLPEALGWFTHLPKRQPPHVQFPLPLEVS